MFDSKRYDNLTPGLDGTVVFPSLIPGAPYKWVTANPKGMFSGPPQAMAVNVKPGETTDLSEVTIHQLELPMEIGK